MTEANPPYPADAYQEADEPHFWDYLSIVLRRRRIVVAIFLAVALAGTLRTFLMRPVYAGTVQILIEHQNPAVLNFKEVAEIDSAKDDYYLTQYKLLQGRALARKAIESLNLLKDPQFGGPRTPEEVEAIRAASPGESEPMEQAIGAFLDCLFIKPIKGSRLVAVSFESPRPELAAQVVNRLAQLYIEQTLEFRYQTSSEASQWLATQIEEQRGRVEAAETTLQALKEKEGIVSIEERRILLDQKLKELGTDLTHLKTLRLQKEALFRQMARASKPEELPQVMGHPVIQSLMIQQANLERQEAQLLQRYLDQHPQVLQMRDQIRVTREKIATAAQQIISAAENDYKAAGDEEASVESALEATKTEILDLSRRALQYDTLKREVDANKEVLNSILSRSKQTDVAQELKSSNIRIVDPAAVPRQPVRPRKLRDLALAFILGAGLGVAGAFFLDYLDNTLKTAEDIRLHLRVPLLGVVPEMEGGAHLVTPERHDHFTESYRVLRTALNYSWSGEAPCRIILVTSTAPGEGKTLTSVNLALTLAFSQPNVLLIDCDLRKPQLHNLLRVKRTPGLSDIVVGKAKPSDAMQLIASYPGVELLTAGTQTPSPGDLLTSQSVRALLEGLRGLYKWIVIDTPPVAAVPEALILAAAADGILVVAGSEMVPRNAVRHTLERIGETGSRILGIALNRARIEKHSYYYGRYYGRYYHYYGHYYDQYRPKHEGRGTEKVTRLHGGAAR